MSIRTQRRPGSAWVTLALVCMACASPQSEKSTATEETVPTVTESWTANRTQAAGVYRVGPVLAELVSVEVGAESGSRTLAPSAWTFDPRSGELTLREAPVREARVRVQGVRAFPWAWRGHVDWDPATVRILHGERELVRDRDFEIDEETRVLRLRSPDLCTAEARYFVVYQHKSDPRSPGLFTSTAFGNHDDDAARRRFLGLPEEPSQESAGLAAGGPQMAIGTNALPTSDPAVFKLTRVLRAEGLRAALAKRDEPGELTWLEPAQFTYEPRTGRLALVGDLRPGQDEYLFVSGVVARANVVHLQRRVDPALVRVVVGERRLELGTGFEVDAETGTVTILAPEFLEPGALYCVTAGQLAVGNYTDSVRLGELLRD